MSIVIGDAVHTGASTPPAPPTTAPSGSAVAFLESIILGWLMISVLIARRFGVFRKQTVVGPARMAGRESPWLLIFLFFVCYALAGLVGPTLIKATHLEGDHRQFTEMHAVYVPFLLFVFAGLALFRTRGFALMGLNLSRFIPGVIGGIVTIFVLYPIVLTVGEVEVLLLRWIGRAPPSTHVVLQKIHDHGSDHVLLFLLVSVAVLSAPMSEEVAFRGCLQTALSYGLEWMRQLHRHARPRLPATPTNSGVVALTENPSPDIVARWGAILLASAAFAAVHTDRGSFAPLFVLAVGLGLAYEITGNLWVTIVAHGTFNATQILIFHAVG